MPKPKSTTKSAPGRTASTSYQAAAAVTPSSVRPSEPITVSSTWQARMTPLATTVYSSGSATHPGSSNSAVASTSSAPANMQAAPDCECGVSAIRKTIETGYSAGKQYWSCQIRDDGCGFYQSIVDNDKVGSESDSTVPTKRAYPSVCLIWFPLFNFIEIAFYVGER